MYLSIYPSIYPSIHLQGWQRSYIDIYTSIYPSFGFCWWDRQTSCGGPTCRMSPVSWSGLTLCGNSNAIERSKTKRAAFRGKNACSNPNFDLQCQQTCLLPLTCQNLGAAAVNDFISVFKCFCLIMEARKVSVSAQVGAYAFTYLFIYFYFIFGVFLPPSRASFIAFVVFPSLGGFRTWGRDFVAIAQLFAAFMVLGGFGYCPAFEGVFVLQSCADCDLPAPWFLLSSPVGSWTPQQELPFYGANTTRSVPALGYPWPSPIIVVLWLCVVFWNASGFRAAGDLLGKQRKGKGALFILGGRAFPMFQHSELR